MWRESPLRSFAGCPPMVTCWPSSRWKASSGLPMACIGRRLDQCGRATVHQAVYVHHCSAGCSTAMVLVLPRAQAGVCHRNLASPSLAAKQFLPGLTVIRHFCAPRDAASGVARRGLALWATVATFSGFWRPGCVTKLELVTVRAASPAGDISRTSARGRSPAGIIPNKQF